MPSRARLHGVQRSFVIGRGIRTIIVGLLCAVTACGGNTNAQRSAGPGVAGSGGDSLAPSTALPSGAIPRQADGLPAGWQTLSNVHGRVAVASRSTIAAGAIITLVHFEHRTTRLVLHPGYRDPGGSGWSTHSVVLTAERPLLLAAFNGGFKLSDGDGGMAVAGRQAGALTLGLASVVTYPDGSTQVGAWGRQLPAPGRAVSSVRQNLHLLVSGGLPAPDIDVISDWGATILGMPLIARSALGIDRQGNLVWAGSMAATPRALAEALISAGVQRAMELDINPYWVCAFSFTPVAQVPILAGQRRPVGTYLTRWQRDFFTVDAK